jgi:predicted amidophosphoribosyltransferase
MTGGASAKIWYKCIRCGKGLDDGLNVCEHCGHNHTEDEMEEIKQDLWNKSRPLVFFAVIFFPALFYFASKWSGNG